MIARISGILEQLDQNRAIIAPSEPGPGVQLAYEVLLTAAQAEKVASQIGKPLTLHTITSLEQQAQGATITPRLIGFATAEDRRFFQLFTTVKGVGVRKALRALCLPMHEVAGAISRRDATALKKLPEIGARLADTIIAELHGKVDAFLIDMPAGDASHAEVKAPITAEPAQQAIAALVRLGESRTDAEQLVQRAIGSNDTLPTADEILAAAFALRS